MKLPLPVVDELRVAPGAAANLAQRSTETTRHNWLQETGRSDPSELADADLERFRDELAVAQQALYASDTWALLIVLQALDAAGKDGTIAHVMSGLNPQGCEVHAFKQPSSEELRHDFLWRVNRFLPERGHIGIFNRSHYEEVLVVRVHNQLLDAEHIPPGGASGARLWRERYEDINAFERHLFRSGTRGVKFFLHVSKEEQRKRLLARLDDAEKRWKFDPQDLVERTHFAEYRRCYEEAITATSTAWAPWYVVPADHKHALRALVGGIVVNEIQRLHPRRPVVNAAARRVLEQARQTLEHEASGPRKRR